MTKVHSPYRAPPHVGTAPSSGPLYAAQSLVEAQLLVDLLAEMNVPTRTTGTHLAGGFGELPYDETLPRIWLLNANDRETALQVIAEYERRRAVADESTLTCPACGEENPANFELCWSCRAEIA